MSYDARPVNPVSEVPVAALVDIGALRQLMDDFTAASGMGTALLDTEGNILQGAGWQKACTDFHRAVAASCANCTESDLYLASRLREGEFVDYQCKNGLWDVVTPVFVGGRHLGNLYCGQFFYDDDVIDEAFFERQAQRYGFEPAAYLAAIWALPRYSREHVRRAMAFLVHLASYLSTLSLANLRLSESQAQMRLAKAEAERANTAKSRFLAAASHDLRQPLSALALYVGVLKSKLADDDAPLARNMEDCVGSLSGLLTNLLDVSKLDAGVVVPQIGDFGVGELLARIVSTQAPKARLKNLHLRYVPSKLTARTDAVLFARLLGNLVANAVHYTETGGVVIGCRRRQGRIWVEVWDSGIGIPKHRTSEIFEEFVRLGGAAHKGGSGLGLAIVAKTAALLGLALRVESRLGRGSMFAVELPPGGGVGTAAAAATPCREKRIALVEDNASVATALICALENIGHCVIAARSGAELLARLKAAPDIVISDYRLGSGETGYDVIESVRAIHGEDLPAVIVTADTDPQLTRSMVERAIPVHYKPVQIEALQECIAELTRPRAI